MRFRDKTSLLLSASLLSLSTGAIAQDSGTTLVDEIIVTATKRASSIQDVPFSINAQTQDDIQRTGAGSLEDVARNVAGLTIQNLGPGQSQVAIRGVSAGQIVRDQPGVKEQVGVYLDESVISLSLFTPDLDLFDLNRVETLRGPQGTLFGSGSVGGTIRFITNQPDPDTTEGVVEASVNMVQDGEAGGHLKGMYNVPLGDKAALRVVAYSTSYGGFIDALTETGMKEDVNGGTRTGFRAALRLEASDTITVTPRIIYQSIDTDGFNRQEVFNLYANPYTTTRTPVQLGEREQYLRLDEKFTDDLLIADLTIELGYDTFDVTSISSLTDREILVSRDASALTGSVSADLGYTDADILLPSNLRDTTDVKQITQELRITSNGEGPLQWLAGIFYSDIERDYAQHLPTPGYDAATDLALGAGTSAAVANGFGADSPYNAVLPYSLQQIAIFAEATYDVTERLHITAGGRYYDHEEDRTFTSGGLFSNGDFQADSTSSSGFNPRLMASFEATDEITLNGQIAQGFRLGGANDPLNLGLCGVDDAATYGGFPTYDDETLWNYEAGVKVKRGGVRFNAAAFYTDIQDLQTTLDAGSCSSRVVYNVPEAHTAGVEFELSGALSNALDFSVSGSLLNAEFDSTVLSSTGAILGGIEEGSRLGSVPKIQLAASMTYSKDLELRGQDAQGYVSVSLQHVGDRYTQPGDQVAGAGDFSSGLTFGGATGTDVTSFDLLLDSYQTLNITGGLDFETWDLQLFITNVTDENANLSFDRERGGRARLGFRTNQPRTFGVTVRKHF
jgi:outer membrane receptor protein involved in Fe transport